MFTFYNIKHDNTLKRAYYFKQYAWMYLHFSFSESMHDYKHKTNEIKMYIISNNCFIILPA